MSNRVDVGFYQDPMSGWDVPVVKIDNQVIGEIPTSIEDYCRFWASMPDHILDAVREEMAYKDWARRKHAEAVEEIKRQLRQRVPGGL